MKFFTAAIALAVAAVAAVANAGASIAITNCAPGSDLTISSIYLDPYPICVGQDLCVILTGTLSAPITAPSTTTII
ncbi:hypothetical protein BGX21_005340, partial [Mortierella sp. AD011]